MASEKSSRSISLPLIHGDAPPSWESSKGDFLGKGGIPKATFWWPICKWAILLLLTLPLIITANVYYYYYSYYEDVDSGEKAHFCSESETKRAAWLLSFLIAALLLTSAAATHFLVTRSLSEQLTESDRRRAWIRGTPIAAALALAVFPLSSLLIANRFFYVSIPMHAAAVAGLAVVAIAGLATVLARCSSPLVGGLGGNGLMLADGEVHGRGGRGGRCAKLGRAVFLLVLCAVLAFSAVLAKSMQVVASSKCPDFESGEAGQAANQKTSISDPSTPNVLLLLVDDLRFDGPFVADAPHLESLMTGQGLGDQASTHHHFSNAYAAWPGDTPCFSCF